VKKGNLQKPTKIEQAKARLDGAVARLEAVAQNGASQGGARGKSEESSKELERLRAENSRLKVLHDDTSSRLDTAIGRLRSAMGE